jgi:hypothetical protein
VRAGRGRFLRALRWRWRGFDEEEEWRGGGIYGRGIAM